MCGLEGGHVFGARDDMFARGNETASGFQHPPDFGTQLLQVTRVVQHLAAMHEVKRGVSKGQLFAPLLHHVDGQTGCLRQIADGACTHDLTRIRLQRRHLPTIAGRFIATREHVVSRTEDVPAFQAAHPLHRLYGGENAFMLKEYVAAITGAGITLSQVLNPKQSNINLYPETQANIKRRWAGILMLPSPRLIPDLLLKMTGDRGDIPGRLYTFFGRKAALSLA
jgi:hypothetical protein